MPYEYSDSGWPNFIERGPWGSRILSTSEVLLKLNGIEEDESSDREMYSRLVTAHNDLLGQVRTFKAKEKDLEGRVAFMEKERLKCHCSMCEFHRSALGPA